MDKKGIPTVQQDRFEFENTKAPTGFDLVPHKLFKLFFDEVINHIS